MKRFLLVPLMVVFVSGLIFGGCAQPTPAPAPVPVPAPAPAPTPAEAVELKAVTFFPPMAPKTQMVKKFFDKVNEEAKGELVIKYLGGPEVVTIYEQGQAVGQGVVDIAVTPAAMYGGMVPEGWLQALSLVTIEEELEHGVVDFLRPLHEKVGLYYLGRVFGTNDLHFLVWTNKKVDRPQELAGHRWGITAPLFTNFAVAFGGTTVMIPLTDIYTALERGMVDTCAFPGEACVSFGAYEALKYAINYPFWVDYTGTIINLDKWNSLPEHLQKVMQDSLLEIAPEVGRLNYQNELKSRQLWRDSGGEYIEFSPEDAEWYLNTIYEATWKAQIQKLPETAPKLKELLSP